MNMSLATRAFALARSAALTFSIAAPTTCASIFVYKNPDALLTLLSRVQTFEVAGVKIAFGEKAFDLNPDLRRSRSGRQEQTKLVQRLAALGPNEVDRLLHLSEIDKDHIGDVDLHCDYDRATSRMRFYAATDEALVEKALVERVARPDLTRKKRDEAGSASEFGAPHNCYQLVLTKDGSDMKSVIVTEVTRLFRNAEVDDTPEKPAAEKPKEKLSRADRDRRALVAAR